MHMSDALISPVVGGTTLAAGSGLLGYSVRSIHTETFEQRLPLMGVMGAFLFAAQMINFAIPGTGSSGHIGGGMLLAIILGPGAAFITMASVLLIQALFFADGGLLAFGCNLINLGFFAVYVAYPMIFRPMVKNCMTKKRLITASIIASVVGLQLGSLGVVIETWISGRTDLPLSTFLLFMQPIHLAIGIVEGVVTGLIVAYLYSQNRQLIYGTESHDTEARKSLGRMILRILIAAIVVGGLFSLYASSNPDGLEWAVFNTAGTEEVVNESSLVAASQDLQGTLAPMADYSLAGSSDTVGTTVSGLIGSLATLALALGAGWLIRKGRRSVGLNE